MKLEKVISGIWGAVLGCMLSLSAVMCMTTAFDFQIQISTLALCCVLTSLVCAVCYTLPLKLLPISAGAVILGFLWRNGSLEESLEALLNRLTRQYDKAYAWGIIRWGYRTADEMEPTILLMLCIIGAVIAMAVTWSVCRRKTALPAILLSALCAGTCFVVTDTLPDVVWLYFLLLAVIVLLLTSRVRHQDEKHGNRLSLFAAPVTALALLLLLACIPQDTYHGQARAARLTEMFFTDPLEFLLGKDSGGAGSGSVDLTTVGFRNNSESPVLEITADFDAFLYLRGRAMNIYDGISWYDSADYEGEIPNWNMLDWPEHVWQSGVVKISTRYAHRMLYTPYYLRKAYMKDAGAGIVNNTGMTEYAFDCQEVTPYSTPDKLYPTPASTYPSVGGGITIYPENITGVRGDESFVIYPAPESVSSTALWHGDMLEQFIRLPDDVRKWAEPLADGITNGIASPYHKALAIAEYVKNSATYDTQTPRMSGRNKDFARWFLEDSTTGYCVHYASAAAVLLQASGIPARYVTGYTAEVTAGETTVVTADKAHAWVEYYLPGFGWTILEATPAAEAQIPTETQETTRPDEETQTSTEVTETSPQQDPAQENRRKYGAVVLNVLAVVAAIAALVAAVWGQYRLRLYVRFRRNSKLNPNELTVVRWRETVRFARLLGQIPEKELFELAQKARFSQHTMTQSELALFDDYAKTAKEKLQKRPWPHRFYYRIILAVY